MFFNPAPAIKYMQPTLLNFHSKSTFGTPLPSMRISFVDGHCVEERGEGDFERDKNVCVVGLDTDYTWTAYRAVSIRPDS